MKYVRIVLGVCALLAGAIVKPALAQSPEFHYRQGGHLDAVSFIDSSRGWTGEDGGRIRFSVDGGQSWTLADLSAITSPEAWGQLNGVFVMDMGGGDVKVWAVGEGGVVLVSTDADGQEFADANSGARVLNVVGEGDPCVAAGQPAILHDIFMLDVDNGWLIGEDGVLRYTEDGGETWEDGTGSPSFSPPSLMGCGEDPYDAYDIHFFADSGYTKGVIAAEFGKLFTTADGGDTWTPINLLGAAPSVCPEVTGDENLEFWAMDFEDPDDPDSPVWLSGGVLTGQSYVFRRSGGWGTNTWSQLRCYQFIDPEEIASNDPETCTAATTYALTVMDAGSSRVLAAGYAGEMYSWETGTGNFDTCECIPDPVSNPCASNAPTWVQQDNFVSPADPCTPRAAYFAAARVGSDSAVAVGDFGRMTFYDNGAGDETVEVGSKHFLRLFDGEFFSSTTGFVVGQRNTIYKTTDGGESFTLIEDFANCGDDDGALNAVDFSDNGQFAVAVGNDGLIVYSTDAGANWSQAGGLGTAHLYDVDIVPGSTQVAYAVGVDGLVRTTTNGVYWRTVANLGSEDLFGLSFLSASVGYVAGEGKKIYRTTTSAGSWSAMTVNGGASETLRDIQAWSSGSVAIAVGDNGRVFEKTSTSTTFEQIDDDTGFPAGITGHLQDVEVLDSGTSVRIAGLGGEVLFRDSGTWSRIRSLTNRGIYKLSFHAADEGFAIGPNFFIARFE